MKRIGLLLCFIFLAGTGCKQDPRSYIDKASEYFDAGNYSQAAVYFKKANESAGGNDAICQFNAGVSYYNAQDYMQAVYWFRKAADLGYARAQLYLGECYENGQGVAKDNAQASYWYRKAAEQGSAEAQEVYSGDVAEQGDADTAAVYSPRAAEQGSGDAQKVYPPKAAEQSNGDAQSYFDKAKEYFEVENYSQAIACFKKANELFGGNDAVCQFNIGMCYCFEEDFTPAVYWFRKAAEQGFARAQSMLGNCYENGEGVTEDMAQAVYWWRKAAEQGDGGAQVSLSVCYYNGEGVAEDMEQAKYWARKAIANENTGPLLKKTAQKILEE